MQVYIDGLIHYVNVKWCQSAEYIDASLDEAVKQYGSVQAYIREGLGITDKELVNFREQLLEPAK